MFLLRSDFIKRSILLLGFVLTLFAQTSFAAEKIIQILHTNDLHSHWRGSEQKDRGGFARIAALMDRLEAEGDAKGWITIRLDAGDFSEGHLTYFVNHGDFNYELMKLMNYDAVALGNHDYLTGIEELERQVREYRDLPMVAANFAWRGHDVSIEPGRVISRGGVRVAVAGATTDADLYRWAAKPAEISNIANSVDDWLAYQKADLKIALTHIGVKSDKILAQKSNHIDVIIGGHSHTVIPSPIWTMNGNHKKVLPIVQTGAHGRYLGQLVIKVPVGPKTKVIDYKLWPITLDMPEDPKVKKMADLVYLSLEQILGVNLNQVVARSDDYYFSSKSMVPIVGNFFADVMRDAAQTEVAVDFGNLYGNGINKGDLTNEDILQLQPHIYNWAKRGWHIKTARMSGLGLKRAVKILSLMEFPIFLSGMDIKMRNSRGFDHFLVNGEPVQNKRIYSVAFSEGFLDGAEANPILKLLIKPPYIDTGIVMRDVIYERALQIKNFDASVFGPRRLWWPDVDKPDPDLNTLPALNFSVH